MEYFEIPGHISYILIAISYYLTNIFWLRVTAVVGLSMEIWYFRLSGGNLSTGIAWDMVFIAINAYQLYWLYDEHRKATRFEGASHFKQGAFAGLSSLQISRLVKAGTWRDVPQGGALTIEGQPVKALFYVANGVFSVVKGDMEVARIEPGAFAGEMAFLSGAWASATVRAVSPSKVFAFDSEGLRKMTRDDEVSAAALHLMLGRDLAQKLRGMNAGPRDNGWGYAGPA